MNLKMLSNPMFEGISHIEDLAVDQFIDALKNFEHYEISEKVDGSNLQFGYDENGFYTSRETKNGTERMRSVDEYPIQFNTTFQRSAHAALEKVFPIIKKAGAIKKGDSVDVEVLFGKLPNVVPYDSSVNRIIFLRPANGTPNIEEMKKVLHNKTVSVTIDAPFTLDGKTINTQPETHVWAFAKTPTTDAKSITNTDLWATVKNKLDELENFLLRPSGIYNFSNAEILSIPLNKRPESVAQQDWKSVKEIIKKKRQEINNKIYTVDKEAGHVSGLKHEIKELLLDQLVRKIKSSFGPEITDGGWIEGVVFRNKENNSMFKVVDKDMFTAVKNFAWKVRDDLTSKPKSLKAVNSFNGKLLVGLATSLGHPELGTMQAKRHLRKLGKTPQEIIDTISKNVKFESVKQYWIKFIEKKQEEFDDLLETYKNEYKDYRVTIKDREFTYDDEIHKRTLQSFAVMKKTLDEMERKARLAKSTADLVMILVGRQLSELGG